MRGARLRFAAILVKDVCGGDVLSGWSRFFALSARQPRGKSANWIHRTRSSVLFKTGTRIRGSTAYSALATTYAQELRSFFGFY